MANATGCEWWAVVCPSTREAHYFCSCQPFVDGSTIPADVTAWYNSGYNGIHCDPDTPTAVWAPPFKLSQADSDALGLGDCNPPPTAPAQWWCIKCSDGGQCVFVCGTDAEAAAVQAEICSLTGSSRRSATDDEAALLPPCGVAPSSQPGDCKLWVCGDSKLAVNVSEGKLIMCCPPNTPTSGSSGQFPSPFWGPYNPPDFSPEVCTACLGGTAPATLTATLGDAFNLGYNLPAPLDNPPGIYPDGDFVPTWGPPAGAYTLVKSEYDDGSPSIGCGPCAWGYLSYGLYRIAMGSLGIIPGDPFAIPGPPYGWVPYANLIVAGLAPDETGTGGPAFASFIMSAHIGVWGIQQIDPTYLEAVESYAFNPAIFNSGLQNQGDWTPAVTDWCEFLRKLSKVSFISEATKGFMLLANTDYGSGLSSTNQFNCSSLGTINFANVSDATYTGTLSN